MQNGAERFTEHNSDHQQTTPNVPLQPTSASESNAHSSVNDHATTENHLINTQQHGTDVPPAKRRKFTGPELGKQARQASPPWKKIQVEGPSTFLEGGVRKSARTNYVPVDLQPQSDKRKTRGATQQGRPPAIKSKYGGATAPATTAEIPNANPKPNGVNGVNGTNGHHPPSVPGKVPHGHTCKQSSKKSKVTGSENSTSASMRPSVDTKLKQKRHSQTLASPSNSQLSLPIAHKPRKVGRPRRSSKSELGGPHDHSATGSLRSDGVGLEGHALSPFGNSPKKPQRLNLRFNMPSVGIYSLGNVIRRQEIHDGDKMRPAFPTFEEWLEREGRSEVEEKDKKIRKIDLRMTEASVQKEARMRFDISKAAEPGGLLSRESCTYWNDEETEAPPRLYTHLDRVLTHMTRFQWLMGQEKKKHLKAAKECAQHAAAFVRAREEQAYIAWTKEQPKTAEEIAQEQQDLYKNFYVQLQEDLKKKWLMVVEIVDDNRLHRWQEEQDRRDKKALNEAIEKSRDLLDRRKRQSIDSDTDGNDENDSDNASGSDLEDESNMSSSGSGSEEEQSLADDDAALTQEELRRKYEATNHSAPAISHDLEGAGSNGSANQDLANNSQADVGTPLTQLPDTNPASILPLSPGGVLEQVDDTLIDDSDVTTDMDDDMTSSAESSSDDGESGSNRSEVGDGLGGLSGFLSKAEWDAMSKAPAQETVSLKEASVDFDASDDEADKVSLIPDVTQGPTPSASTSEEPQLQPRKDSDTYMDVVISSFEAPAKPSAGKDRSIDEIGQDQSRPGGMEVQEQDTEMPATPVSTHNLKTPVPSLLRGTLREYQHYGLDWLAGLYGNGTNGILADEMGLGKTIQTIALLAYLAEHYEAWGPHLIVVPTSVMLNWEMEFKKFLPGFKVLTYYGTQEERKRKRAGWMDNDKWNVWITSYTLITQDQQIFRRKAWHYMILDEAHNIKNFQSLRWQTLLTFRTRARLLLTGTPLQNNLTELWSLLYFLMPSDGSETGIAGFTSLDEFSGWFKKPTEQILEQGREALDNEARDSVRKLHNILRPYLLRRLKADVEKQMPGKYEHVVLCRLSKRQRYLYDGFMSRAQTRETLASGNTFSIMNALMQLRKVCNHPDLFETRQIVTSFAMPKSAVADFEIKELLVRRRLLHEEPLTQVDLNLVNLLPGANESVSALDTVQKQRLGALGAIRQLTSRQGARVDWKFHFDGSTVQSTLAHFENNARRLRYDKLHQTSYLTSLRSQRRPLYSYDLMERLRFGIKSFPHQPMPRRRDRLSDWYTQQSPALHSMISKLPERSERMATTIQKFACITPAAVASDMVDFVLGPRGIHAVQAVKRLCPQDPFHESRVRQSIAFPDKRLLQYDCGKLQKLDALMRRLQTEGHRALIFTQMTRVLDILEQFMNIHGHRYLRLDGATKLEQRQMLTERFNNDDRILAFILSSRSGGIGINLTGADTVIFYDLDWNPAMDKQCQDRCHRIGQTRDVHIYRLVSEHTIEANILRKANQKRMLDDVVIQEGDFTTDYFNNMSVKDIVGNDLQLGDADDAANAAMDRVLGNRAQGRVLEAVEDQDDAKAAKEAEKEVARFDADDFDERGAGSTSVSTPKTPGPAEGLPTPHQRPKQLGDVEMTTTMEAAESGLVVPNAPLIEEEVPSCDDYMIRFLDWQLADVPVEPPLDKKKRKKGKESLGRKK